VRRIRLGLVLFALFAVVPASAQTVEGLDPPKAPADFLVIPLRVHVLTATDLPEVACNLADADIKRVVAKVNAVWHKAGIHWALDPIVREAAARQDQFKAARKDDAEDPLLSLKILVPDESRSDAGVDVYYIHQFGMNGVYLGDRVAFVQEMAELRPVEGGIDEPLPRVTAHELGHALGLPHRQDRTNLLASGTTGTTLNEAEVARARARALRIPGTSTALELRRRATEAQARGDSKEADRLGAILRGVPADQDSGKPASTVEPTGAGLR